jgi:hypothetical protein
MVWSADLSEALALLRSHFATTAAVRRSGPSWGFADSALELAVALGHYHRRKRSPQEPWTGRARRREGGIGT